VREAGFDLSKTMKPCLLIFAWLLLMGNLHAQQNLFNIPSGDITKKGKLFYQHQLNFYQWNELESKSHLVVGLGNGWDAGMNLVDVPLRIGNNAVLSYNDNSARKPLYPLAMLTLQKQLVLGEKTRLNLGTQAGPNITSRVANKRMAFFSYAILRTKLFNRINWVIGPYHTDNTFVGRAQHQVGLIAGYEWPLTRRFSLMGDFISGRHKKAQTTFGALYTINPRVQLCVAALLDYPHGQNNHGVVLELNLFGWDIEQH
jgi:hypothetical protein